MSGNLTVAGAINGIASSAESLITNGYVIFYNGLILQWTTINASSAYSVINIDLPIEFTSQIFYYHVYGLYANSSKMPIAWGNYLPKQSKANVSITKRSYDFNNNSWINWSWSDEALTMIAIGV